MRHQRSLCHRTRRHSSIPTQRSELKSPFISLFVLHTLSIALFACSRDRVPSLSHSVAPLSFSLSSLTLADTHSLAHSFTRFHTPALPHPRTSHSLSHTLSQSHIPALSHSHKSLILSHSRTLTHSHSLSLTFSLSHSHSRVLTLSRIPTQTPSHSPSHSLSPSHSPSHRLEQMFLPQLKPSSFRRLTSQTDRRHPKAQPIWHLRSSKKKDSKKSIKNSTTKKINKTKLRRRKKQHKFGFGGKEKQG